MAALIPDENLALKKPVDVFFKFPMKTQYALSGVSAATYELIEPNLLKHCSSTPKQGALLTTLTGKALNLSLL